MFIAGVAGRSGDWAHISDYEVSTSVASKRVAKTEELVAGPHLFCFLAKLVRPVMSTIKFLAVQYLFPLGRTDRSSHHVQRRWGVMAMEADK